MAGGQTDAWCPRLYGTLTQTEKNWRPRVNTTRQSENSKENSSKTVSVPFLLIILSLMMPYLYRTWWCDGLPKNHGQYSPTFLQNILSLVLQIFLYCILYLAAFECNTAPDWLNHRFSQLEVVFDSNLHILIEIDKECSWKWFVNTNPCVLMTLRQCTWENVKCCIKKRKNASIVFLLIKSAIPDSNSPSRKILYHAMSTFNDPRKKPFENTMFSTLSKTEIIIWATFILSSANAFNLVTSKILLFGIELISW